MLKSLVEHEKIETTVTKAKELRRHADKLVTLAKKNIWLENVKLYLL
jgi:large subunit ribosomal protein L17